MRSSFSSMVTLSLVPLFYSVAFTSLVASPLLDKPQRNFEGALAEPDDQALNHLVVEFEPGSSTLNTRHKNKLATYVKSMREQAPKRVLLLFGWADVAKNGDVRKGVTHERGSGLAMQRMISVSNFIQLSASFGNVEMINMNGKSSAPDSPPIATDVNKTSELTFDQEKQALAMHKASIIDSNGGPGKVVVMTADNSFAVAH